MTERIGLDAFLEQKGYGWQAMLAEFPCLMELADVKQDFIWHAEGDVLEHTRRVCEAVVSGREWQSLDRKDRAILYMRRCFTTLERKAARCRRLRRPDASFRRAIALLG